MGGRSTTAWAWLRSRGSSMPPDRARDGFVRGGPAAYAMGTRCSRRAGGIGFVRAGLARAVMCRSRRGEHGVGGFVRRGRAGQGVAALPAWEAAACLAAGRAMGHVGAMGMRRSLSRDRRTYVRIIRWKCRMSRRTGEGAVPPVSLSRSFRRPGGDPLSRYPCASGRTAPA